MNEIGSKEVVTGLAVIFIVICMIAFPSPTVDERIRDIEQRTGCVVEKDACRGCTPLTVPDGRYSSLHWMRCPATDGGTR